MVTELHYLSIAQTARLIRQRKVSSVEVTQAAWDRFDEINARLNSFITPLRSESLEAARQADELMAKGEYRGPLHGIPITLKDLYFTKGVLTTAGSRLMADHVPEEDSTVTSKLRDAGSILMGKANMSEFACGGVDHVFGPVTNPWDTTRSPGGSSSGSGASITAGIGYASMGSDTGGSIRLPAGFCGCVGLKPTYGRVSRRGVVVLSWTLDHAGPLTRTVRDAAIVLQAIAGHDPGDQGSSTAHVPSFTRGLPKRLDGVVIGVPDGSFYVDLDKDVGSALDEALKTFQSLGARTRKISIPSAQFATLAMLTILQAEGAAYHWQRVEGRLGEMGDTARSRIVQGLLTPAAVFIQAQRIRTLLIEEFRAAMREVDAVIVPTTARPARPLEESSVITARPQTPAFNLTGQPSMSIPCGFSSENLPIGMQIVGRPFDELGVIRIGHAFEQATDWHQRRPPL